MNNTDNTIREYIEEMKELYNKFIIFINESENEEEDFRNLIEFINKQKIYENKEKFIKFLQLITNIASNHHRDESLFRKIFQIIQNYKEKIKQIFTNDEIFNIFQDNKKILLFLFENKIVIMNDNIYQQINFKAENNGIFYIYFFYPEIKEFIGNEKIKTIEDQLSSIDPTIFDRFEENRQKGENENYICSLIREDSVEDFISYVNKTNISLTSEINGSIFETNSILNDKEFTMIEYSAFYGSIQIFQYLKMNKVKLVPSLWLYAIHSRNAELIHLLESEKVEPPDNDYYECLYESIKCHHNDIAEYIEYNLLPPNSKENKNDEVLSCIYRYQNYSYLFNDIKNIFDDFYFLCRYDYNELVNLFIKKEEKSIEEYIIKEILNLHFFFLIMLQLKKQRQKIKL